ncbi:uncharacterized protein YjiS (DUF1127 family) [Sagittula marina]|uniref:Uncharacterized protein YjiS (DUF1127 family) n=1 Tax=Sagittula marina TaxID=943940 RepID=A0A7W6DT76_9RHOB|nr:hypothetical protein [Sagittula marina]MBB3985618.1 uncharacterized protein YjiS (DUF1127 family) [Sagittula marina]
MAYVEHVADNVFGSGLRDRLARLLETPFDRRYRERADAVASLRSKTDADLAAMGLKRSDILSHVFSGRSARH